MLNFSTYRYVYIEKNMAYVGLSTIWGFRYPRGVLENIPLRQGETTVVKKSQQV